MIELFLCLIIPIYAEVVVDNKVPERDHVQDSRAEDNYVVQTETGPVQGYKMEDADILQYFDIPYGRFHTNDPLQEPSVAAPWTDTLQNQQHEKRCPQLKLDGTYTGTTECLTLSVFAPKAAENVEVLFHIHDGDFIAGSGDPDVYSPKQLVPEGVILVLPNYRVGPLGFICVQDTTVKGNAALKDLALALNWVKNNIQAFGGNASNIAVSGSGSGGALVDYLLIANKTKHHIAKAITESGFALSHWAIDRDPLKAAEINIASFSNLESFVRNYSDVTLKPCIESEGGLIVESFWTSLQTQNISIPVMIGSANHAGMQAVLRLDQEQVSLINEDLSQLLPNDLAWDEKDKNELGNRVKLHYFGYKKITINEIDKLSLCFTDCGYLSPGVRQARALTQAGATVYFYEFSYTGYRNSPIKGAAKGDSLHYVFQKDSPTVEQTDDEEGANEMKTIMKKLWISFIKSGIPTIENVQWEAFGSTPEKEECLEIGTELKLLDHLHSERLKLWDEIYERHFIENNFGSTLKSPMLLIFINIIATFNLVLSID
ncbi:cholinesterase 2-like [Colias croceus]|uniref:cholinesterase 2-like n=1 Tax=Colias crocea TaxID=72248 RepID=UPI001E27FE0F|nr:cholinesterase 2-like [Colias croceus]